MKSKKLEIKKTMFYYYENEITLAKVTVCFLLESDGDIARGISILNNRMDQDDVEDGNNQARLYAMKALRGKIEDVPKLKRKEAIDAILDTDCPFIVHSELNPTLTLPERKILFGYKKLFKEEEDLISPNAVLSIGRYDFPVLGNWVFDFSNVKFNAR